jgi:hypothetical protein
VASTGRRRAKTAIRARSALAWGVALFVCAQIGVRLLLQADPELGEREFGRKLSYLRAALAENPGRPLILMLGSSRMATGFRPEALPRLPATSGRTPVAFNFALVGSGPEISHLVLHRLLAAGIRPAWVYVEYWPPFWTTERSFRDVRGQIDIGRLDPQGVQLLGGYLRRPRILYRAWIEAQVAPSYAYRSTLLSRFAPAWVAPNPTMDHTVRNLERSGWWSPRTTVMPDYDRAVLAKMLAHYAPILAKYQVRPTPDRALRAILDLCRSEKIHAGVVVLPEGDEFRKCYAPSVLAKVDDYLNLVRRKSAVPVIDARLWIAESAFLDSHHLFPEGANQFTARLGREIIVPQVAGQAGTPRGFR